MKKAVGMYMMLGLALLVLATSAKANVLAPGGSVVPDGLTASGAVLADTGWMPFSMIDGTSGLVAEIVVADTANINGAGDLTFIYQFQVTTGHVANLTGFDYTGFATDVEAGVGCGTGISILCIGTSPDTVSRSGGGGSTVEFNYALPLAAGAASDALTIATDATAYKPGTIGLIDGGGAGVVGYAPSVPEPATLSLMGMGLLSLLGLRKRENA